MSEHRTGAELPCFGVGVVDGHTGHVGWKEVGVPLDPGQVGAKTRCNGSGEDGLADARDVLYEEVASCQDGDDSRSDRRLDTEEGTLQVLLEGGGEL